MILHNKIELPKPIIKRKEPLTAAPATYPRQKNRLGWQKQGQTNDCTDFSYTLYLVINIGADCYSDILK
jgi:hypothetical protein